LLPQLVLPDSPHEGSIGVNSVGGADMNTKAAGERAPLRSFLSFTPAVSPVDSPVLALPSLGAPEPAMQEGMSRHLDTEENQFEKELAAAKYGESQKGQEGGAEQHGTNTGEHDWRDAVDNFIGEGDG
jgi:hypothetical protein